MTKNFRKATEDSLQQAVITYIRLKFPNVIATSESAGRGLSVIQEVNAKRLRTTDGLPDLMILHINSQYNGLFLELKKHKTAVLKKNGELLSNEHLLQQHKTLAKLREQRYYADFCVGIDEAMRIIDNYMANQPIEPKYIPLNLNKK